MPKTSWIDSCSNHLTIHLKVVCVTYVRPGSYNTILCGNNYNNIILYIGNNNNFPVKPFIYIISFINEYDTWPLSSFLPLFCADMTQLLS